MDDEPTSASQIAALTRQFEQVEARLHHVEHPHDVGALSHDELAGILDAMPHDNAKLYLQGLFDAGDVQAVDDFVNRVHPVVRHGGHIHIDNPLHFTPEERRLFKQTRFGHLSKREFMFGGIAAGGVGYMSLGGLKGVSKAMGINQHRFPRETTPERRAVQTADETQEAVMPVINVLAGLGTAVAAYKALAVMKVRQVAIAVNQLGAEVARHQSLR